MGIVYSRRGGTGDVTKAYVDQQDVSDRSYTDIVVANITSSGGLQEEVIHSNLYGDLDAFTIGGYIHFADYPDLDLGEVLFIGNPERSFDIDPDNIQEFHVMLQGGDFPGISVYEWTMISGVNTGGWSWQTAENFGIQGGFLGDICELTKDSLSFESIIDGFPAPVSQYNRDSAWINGPLTVSGEATFTGDISGNHIAWNDGDRKLTITVSGTAQYFGEDLVQNGGFTTASGGWEYGDSEWEWTEPYRIDYIGGNSQSPITQTVSGLTLGRAYSVGITIGRDSETFEYNKPGIAVLLGTAGVLNGRETGSHSWILTYTGGDPVIYLYPQEGFVGYISEVNICEVSENPVNLLFSDETNGDQYALEIRAKSSYVAIGASAAKYALNDGVYIGNETGTYATGAGLFIGETAGYNNTGDYPIGIGFGALAANEGAGNIGLGNHSLPMSFGEENIGIGNNALWMFSNGEANISIGRQSGSQFQYGSRNIFIGDIAGSAVLHGDNNIFIGNIPGYDYEEVSYTLRIEGNWDNYYNDPLISGDFLARTIDIAGELTVSGLAFDGPAVGSAVFSVSGTEIVHNLGDASHSIMVTAAGSDDFDPELVSALGTIYVKKGTNSDWVYKTGDASSDTLGFDYIIVRIA
jgi:hypothetical protein